MWDDLSSHIVTVIKQSGLIDMAHVYDYAKSDIPGYPAITVTAADGDGTRPDPCGP